jgi:hypothetical protein
MNQPNLTRLFENYKGSSPITGDLFDFEDFVYQYRNGKWIKICPLVQEGVSENKALHFEVGMSHLKADLPHMLAFLHEISCHDPRVKCEDFVSTVINLFEEGGYCLHKEDAKPEAGHITAIRASDQGYNEFETTDVGFVLSQLRDPSIGTDLEIPKGEGKITFLNKDVFQEIEVDTKTL